jgi:hypothetical protein
MPDATTLYVDYVPPLADPELIGGQLALMLPDRLLVVENSTEGRDRMAPWLRLALGCLEAASEVLPPLRNEVPDWRWHVIVPALESFLRSTLDAEDLDDLTTEASTLALTSIALRERLYRKND